MKKPLIALSAVAAALSFASVASAGDHDGREHHPSYTTTTTTCPPKDTTTTNTTTSTIAPTTTAATTTLPATTTVVTIGSITGPADVGDTAVKVTTTTVEATTTSVDVGTAPTTTIHHTPAPLPATGAGDEVFWFAVAFMLAGALIIAGARFVGRP